jgi:toxin ParE1/3/4
MAKVFRSRQAEEDLLAISEHIARDNPSAALQWLNGIEAKLNLLAKQPLIGEAVNHIRAGLRRSIYGNYLIFYEPEENGIRLARVLHGARKIEDLLK